MRSNKPIGCLRIAVVDDVPEIRELARVWLSAAGHSVACAAHGIELGRMSCDHRFDVVITDVMMPEADGLEVIGGLRQSYPGTRIIAISGGGITMLADDCLRVAKRLGADDVLPKPFNRAQLLAVLARVTTPAAVADTQGRFNTIGCRGGLFADDQTQARSEPGACKPVLAGGNDSR